MVRRPVAVRAAIREGLRFTTGRRAEAVGQVTRTRRQICSRGLNKAARGSGKRNARGNEADALIANWR